METQKKTIITVESKINAPMEKVWKLWTTPKNIVKWNHASDDRHSPRAENDLRAGGIFNYRMEAKDGSMGFDFGGIYKKVKTNELITYTLGDNRKVRIDFTGSGNETKIVETFEAENVYSIEQQQGGWQSILDNFKKYAEVKQ